MRKMRTSSLLPYARTCGWSSCIWYKVAPILSPEASVWRVKGKLKSGHAKTGGEVNLLRLPGKWVSSGT